MVVGGVGGEDAGMVPDGLEIPDLIRGEGVAPFLDQVGRDGEPERTDAPPVPIPLPPRPPILTEATGVPVESVLRAEEHSCERHCYTTP